MPDFLLKQFLFQIIMKTTLLLHKSDSHLIDSPLDVFSSEMLPSGRSGTEKKS